MGGNSTSTSVELGCGLMVDSAGHILTGRATTLSDTAIEATLDPADPSLPALRVGQRYRVIVDPELWPGPVAVRTRAVVRRDPPGSPRHVRFELDPPNQLSRSHGTAPESPADEDRWREHLTRRATELCDTDPDLSWDHASRVAQVSCGVVPSSIPAELRERDTDDDEAPAFRVMLEHHPLHATLEAGTAVAKTQLQYLSATGAGLSAPQAAESRFADRDTIQLTVLEADERGELVLYGTIRERSWHKPNVLYEVEFLTEANDVITDRRLYGLLFSLQAWQRHHGLETANDDPGHHPHPGAHQAR
jgi:hypothetical protein